MQCKIIGVRSGPHDLYHTDLLATLPVDKVNSIVTNIARNNRVKLFKQRQSRCHPVEPITTTLKSAACSHTKSNVTTRRLTWNDVLKRRVINVRTAPSIPMDSPIRGHDLMTAALKLQSRLLHGPPIRIPNPKSILTNKAARRKLTPTSRVSHPARPPAEPPPLSEKAQKDEQPTWTTSTSTERAFMELRSIHCAMGHLSNDVLTQALRTSPVPRLRSLCKYVKLMDRCNVCPAGTQKASAHPKKASSRATQYLDRLVMDLSGRQPVPSLGGNYYFSLSWMTTPEPNGSASSNHLLR